MNNCNFVGRLTKDPEPTSLSTGKACCKFTIAVDKGYKDAQGNRQADFIPCIAWEKTATLVTQYFKRGSLIGVTGRLDTKSYEDNQGNKRTSYNIVVNNIDFIGGKAETKTEEQAPKEENTAPNSEAMDDKSTNEPNYELPDGGETDGLPFDV